jgi:hypothetical protein
MKLGPLLDADLALPSPEEITELAIYLGLAQNERFKSRCRS